VSSPKSALINAWDKIAIILYDSRLGRIEENHHVSYQDLHSNRLRETAALIDGLNTPNNASILELGSPQPIVTCVSNIKSENIFTADIKKSTYEHSFQIDLNKDDVPGSWDLVICTEVLEHLTCNLDDALKRIMSSVKKNGYAVFSVPIGIVGIFSPLNADCSEKLSDHSGHYREFTPGKARKFFRSQGCPILVEKIVYNNGLHWHYCAVIEKL
jgi:hypothetical protein